MKKLSHNFSVLKFAIIFIILYFGFYGLIGISFPGGKVYSEFIDKDFNLIKWYTLLLSHGAAFLLHLLGYTVSESNYYEVHIANGGGVLIGFSCLGGGVISAWVAFVAAHNDSVWRSLKWIAIGLLVIIFSNMVRIALLALFNYNHYNSILRMNHHTVYNIILYILVFLLAFWYIRKTNRLELQS